MPNIYAGITNLQIANNLATFKYLTYEVVMMIDASQVHVYGPDGKATTIRNSNIGRTEAAIIATGKRHIIAERSRQEDADQGERRDAIMSKVDTVWPNEPWPVIESYMYRDYRIDVVSDQDAGNCPWDEWDVEPSAICRRGISTGWFDAYGKNSMNIDDHRIPRALNAGQFAIRYIEIMHQGVAEEFFTSSERYIGYYTGDEIDQQFGGDKALARYALEQSIKTFNEWAEGYVHGVVVTHDGEDVESLWNIYAHGDYSYAISEGIDIVDGAIEHNAREQASWNEEIRGEIEAETGNPATFA